MKKEKFVYVTYIRTTPAKLWDALIKPEFTRQFWCDTVQECDWKFGALWKLVAPDGMVADSGEVVEIDPPPDFNGQWPWSTDPSGEMGFFAMKRHGRGINILFFDGSARNTPVKNLWQLPWHQNWNTTNETGVFPAWMD